MATTSRTYNASDWSIWTYVPEPGAFLLDFSQLNGPDVLGTTGGSMQILDADISSVTLISGSEVDQGIFLPITPMIMQASLSVKNFTATDANKFYVGTDIWLTLDNESGYSEPNFGLTTPFFIGRIRDFNVDVRPGEDFATINLSCSSDLEDDLNTLVPVFTTTTLSKTLQVINYASEAGIRLSPINFQSSAYSIYNFATTRTEVKSYGDWLQDIYTCDMTMGYDSVTPEIGPWLWGANAALSTVGTPVKTFGDEDISDVVFGWSGVGSPTGVNLTNYFNSDLVYQFGGSSNSQNFTYSATIDVKDINEMSAVGKKMLSMNKAFRPIEVATETARTYQQITFDDRYGVFYYPTNLAQVGDTVAIDLPDQGFSNVPMLVTGRIMEITPDTWTTTYNLWKGFTN
jgi:hypothetical protein